MIRNVQIGDDNYKLIGTEVTFSCDLVTFGGSLLHKKGEKAIIRDVVIIPAHSYRTLPNIWVKEEISSIRVHGVSNCDFRPDTFIEFPKVKN